MPQKIVVNIWWAGPSMSFLIGGRTLLGVSSSILNPAACLCFSDPLRALMSVMVTLIRLTRNTRVIPHNQKISRLLWVFIFSCYANVLSVADYIYWFLRQSIIVKRCNLIFMALSALLWGTEVRVLSKSMKPGNGESLAELHKVQIEFNQSKAGPCDPAQKRNHPSRCSVKPSGAEDLTH
jgi:hypothetical protein